LKVVGKEEIKQILSLRFEDDICKSLKDLPSPYLFKDIKKASKRVARAINNNEKIVVVGDYDVDGVVSSVLMSEFFEDIDYEIELIIPNRFEDGYGINVKLLERIKADLIITVDNGISAIEAAKVCKERGVDLIITDHHNIPEELPDAYAIINPKQEDCNFPSSEICGAQVAWYFIAALKNELGLEKYDLRKFLDLLAIAIVADMMELKGLNRIMVKVGFKMINQDSRVVFKAIKEYFNKDKFVSDDLSFLLSPLINSAGRMESAMFSYEMLRSKDFISALKSVEYVASLNDSRKEIESDIFEQALSSCDDSSNIIVVWGDGWHEGVIGIVAARICRRFNKPAIVFSVDGDIAKGSARSVGSIDILSYISKQKDLLIGFGGHKSAAGMAIESKNLSIFKEALKEASKDIKDEEFLSANEVLGEIDVDHIDFHLLEILEEFEPYGQKNPKPKFLLKGAKIKDKRVLGISQNHLKLFLDCKKGSFESIYFNFSKGVDEGEEIDLVFTLGKNEFRGESKIQLLIDRIL